ncbi:MAG: hypothetical protein ACK4L7_07220 [Flavobacteriales bacterium]
MIVVYCDQPYDEGDYLRVRHEFEALKRT